MLQEMQTGLDTQSLLDDVKDIYRSVGWVRTNRNWDRLIKSLDKSDFAMGYYEGDRLIGYISAIDDGLYVFVSTLVVHSDFHGRGIGKQLIEALEGHYPNYRITLTTRKAQAFYEGLGFEHIAPGMQKDTTGEG